MKRGQTRDRSKTAPKNKSVEYELMVRDMMQTLLDAQGLDTIVVQHNVRLKGVSGQRHQIDVYWEYRLAGITHRVIINCKFYSRKVEIGAVRDMQGVVADIPGTQGVIVTTKNYQTGAIKYAKTHGIGLKVIRPALKEDYAGRARTAISRTFLVIPDFIKPELLLDGPWAREHIPDPDGFLKRVPQQCDTFHTWVNDLDKGERVTIADLLNRLDFTREPDIEHMHSFHWKNAMVEYPSLPAVKIAVLNVTYKLRRTEGPVIHVGPTVGDTLVKDAIKGTLLFIDKDREITGDRKEDREVTGDRKEESITRNKRPRGRGRSK